MGCRTPQLGGRRPEFLGRLSWRSSVWVCGTSRCVSRAVGLFRSFPLPLLVRQDGYSFGMLHDARAPRGQPMIIKDPSVMLSVWRLISAHSVIRWCCFLSSRKKDIFAGTEDQAPLKSHFQRTEDRQFYGLTILWRSSTSRNLLENLKIWLYLLRKAQKKSVMV